ncbi:MAG: hypothetical protein EBR93_05920, partial [Bacteroidetes bacterium]|nr:hypothetical protein [Bacteroidota bacterium]
MAVMDIGQHTQCPRSFGNWNDAQYLLGAINLRSTIYITMPTSLTIHNDHTLLNAFDPMGQNSTSWALTFRIIFLTAIDIGSLQRFSVRLYVGTVILSKPKASFATLAVSNACRLLGLLSPPNSHLKMHVGVDKQPVCMWDCRIDAMRTPWNLYPKTKDEITSTSEIGTCRPLTKYFTAAEFLFIIDTALPTTNAERLNTRFFDDLNAFTASLEMAIATSSGIAAANSMQDSNKSGNSYDSYSSGVQGESQKYQLMALTVPGSDFDTHNWHSWIRSFITFSHRNDVMFDSEFMNETLLLNSLQTLGIYQVIENEDFIHDAALLMRRIFTSNTHNNLHTRRFSTQAITVKGLFFTNDVTSQLSSFTKAIKDTITQSTFQFSPNLQVNKPVLVDVRRMHRVALPSNETIYLMDMHRAGVYTIQISVLLTIVLMMLYKTT